MSRRHLSAVLLVGLAMLCSPAAASPSDGGHFSAGTPASPEANVVFVEIPVGHGLPLPPVPRAVRRAGGRTLEDFKAGRIVFAQTGCEACHRIGDQGNRRPGRALTHIGSTFSPPQLRRALVDSRAPMPSFKNLPAPKRKALVEFLALLR